MLWLSLTRRLPTTLRYPALQQLSLRAGRIAPACRGSWLIGHFFLPSNVNHPNAVFSPSALPKTSGMFKTLNVFHPPGEITIPAAAGSVELIGIVSKTGVYSGVCGNDISFVVE